MGLLYIFSPTRGVHWLISAHYRLELRNMFVLIYNSKMIVISMNHIPYLGALDSNNENIFVITKYDINMNISLNVKSQFGGDTN